LSLSSGLAEKTISEILNGKNPVTPETALKFERILKISSIGLLKMQVGYDSDVLRISELKRLQGEVQYLERFKCYSELAKLGFVKKVRDKVQMVEELLRFFAVDSLLRVEQVVPVAFRKSNTKKVNSESLAAWLRMGVIEAQKKSMEVAEFNQEKLKANIEMMRRLMLNRAEEYYKELVELCAECGVVFVCTNDLRGTYVNGATRWLTPKKVLVQMTLRNAYEDIFWFTFFHEIGHVLKHSKKEIFVDLTGQDQSELEQEADAFAQKILIPATGEFSKLIETLKSLDCRKWNVAISYFADKNAVSKGVVAGRVAKETGEWRVVSKLRTKLQLVS